jgi:phosphoenolpyruvate-protein kinase (PTS system EI component)
MRIIRGIPAARGIAIGPVYLYKPLAIEIQYCQIEDPAKEWKRLQSAIQTASHELHLAHEQAQEKIGDSEAAIFEAHLEMLDDPELLDLTRNTIEDQRINAETAFNNAAETYASTMEAMEDEYFRARAADIRDVKKRVLRILLGLEDNPFASLNTPSIILAQDLTPSDTIALDKSLVLGFCTASGGSTSHTAILARGLGLPAIVGAGNDILAIPGDSQVILDGQSGELTVDAGAATIEKYRQKQLSAIQSQEAAVKKARQPAITRDGKQVEVVANIGSVEEASKAMELGAEGVGLLRTEFLYLREERLPDEEEQYTAYRAILDSFGYIKVTISKIFMYT